MSKHTPDAVVAQLVKARVCSGCGKPLASLIRTVCPACVLVRAQRRQQKQASASRREQSRLRVMSELRRKVVGLASSRFMEKVRDRAAEARAQEPPRLPEIDPTWDALAASMFEVRP